mmetsp:Transcript_6241/g.17414  ORF Transcript_6241/g.17414 Transcript_6241/m.17414 type:complete len:328 (-) Transcript_6241:48-1031(-)
MEQDLLIHSTIVMQGKTVGNLVELGHNRFCLVLHTQDPVHHLCLLSIVHHALQRLRDTPDMHQVQCGMLASNAHVPTHTKQLGVARGQQVPNGAELAGIRDQFDGPTVHLCSVHPRAHTPARTRIRGGLLIGPDLGQLGLPETEQRHAHGFVARNVIDHVLENTVREKDRTSDDDHDQSTWENDNNEENPFERLDRAYPCNFWEAIVLERQRGSHSPVAHIPAASEQVNKAGEENQRHGENKQPTFQRLLQVPRIFRIRLRQFELLYQPTIAAVANSSNKEEHRTNHAHQNGKPEEQMLQHVIHKTLFLGHTDVQQKPAKRIMRTTT